MACCLAAPSHYRNQCRLVIQWCLVAFTWCQFYRKCSRCIVNVVPHQLLPGATGVKLKSSKISFVHTIHVNCQIILTFYTEHGSNIIMLCAKFQNDLTNKLCSLCNVWSEWLDTVYFPTNLSRLRKAHKYVEEELRKRGIIPHPAEATFFIWADFRKVSRGPSH